jgi:hypothetical protein
MQAAGTKAAFRGVAIGSNIFCTQNSSFHHMSGILQMSNRPFQM